MNDRRLLMVRDVLRESRAHAIELDFRQLLGDQETLVDLSWVNSRAQKHNRAERHRAAVRTIAHGLALQQLGYLERAATCFQRLLAELGLRHDHTLPANLHNELGDETGDDALVLRFRLDGSALGSNECERRLETATEWLRLHPNKAKFYWRLHTSRALAQSRFDVSAFEEKYVEMTGQEWANATSNTMNTKLAIALVQAERQRPEHCARYFDKALHWARQSSKAGQDYLFDEAAAPSHLITHSVMCGLRDVVAIRWRIAQRRGIESEMQDLEILWCEIEDLRHDSHVHSEADGFRELDQIDRAIFGIVGPRIRSFSTYRRQDGKAAVPNSAQRLRALCARVDAL